MALRADDVDLGRDRALVEQYQDGDIAAFESLYRRYYGRLYRFCLRRTGDPHEAEELTQEAFARAYRAMPALRGERRFYPWLSVIASRLCIDSHRRLGRTEPAAEVDPGAVDGGHDDIEAAVDYDLLQRALTRLTPRHREVLHLREREGWSYQRIAEHYGISLGAVEGLLFRARAALRREFLAVAGPEPAETARPAFIPVLGLGGWLSRGLARIKTRVNDWAVGWGNLSGLATNSMGLAMVVATAAGLGSVAAAGAATHPINVQVSAPATSAQAAAAQPSANDATTTSSTALHNPRPTSATGALVAEAAAANPVHKVPYDGGAPITQAPKAFVANTPGAGPVPGGPTGAGAIEPEDAVSEALGRAGDYPNQAQAWVNNAKENP